MTPVEFVTVGSALEDPSWKKDIQWDGKSLSLLIEVQREREERERKKDEGKGMFVWHLPTYCTRNGLR